MHSGEENVLVTLCNTSAKVEYPVMNRYVGSRDARAGGCGDMIGWIQNKDKMAPQFYS